MVMQGNIVWELAHLSYEGTYLSVPPENEFKSILSCRDLGEYLEYQYLSCPRLGLQKREDQTFSFLGPLQLSGVLSRDVSRQIFRRRRKIIRRHLKFGGGGKIFWDSWDNLSNICQRYFLLSWGFLWNTKVPTTCWKSQRYTRTRRYFLAIK